MCHGDVISGDIDSADHFSLGVPFYVQFTSPIRRFMDIVVQRFVAAAIDNEPAPYNADEVRQGFEQICVPTRYDWRIVTGACFENQKYSEAADDFTLRYPTSSIDFMI